jgi:hypothetical protein
MIKAIFFTSLVVSVFSFSKSEQAYADTHFPSSTRTDNGSFLGGGNFDRFFNDPALTAVTREFGQSVISMRNLPYRSEVGSAYHKPWSSWWFPKKDEVLFKGSSSALSKYDQFRKLRYRLKGKPTPRSAAEFESNAHNPHSLAWEGLCDAWSMAAILKPEPKRPVTMRIGRDAITFSVADLKALLLKTYENVDDADLKYYGQKFTGDARGWIFADIFPNEFHRFLEVQLFQRKQAFIMDHDPGVEVWNVPVYKANYLIDAIPSDPNAVAVTAWVFSAEFFPFVDRESVGTREAIRTYHYVLRGNRNIDGNLVVSSGDWIKGSDGIDSTRSHPDFITAVANPLLVRKSYNPEIEIDLVDEILLASY